MTNNTRIARILPEREARVAIECAPDTSVRTPMIGRPKRVTRVGSSSFTAFSESVIHYAYLEVGVDQLVVHAIDAQGAEFDSLVVAR